PDDGAGAEPARPARRMARGRSRHPPPARVRARDPVRAGRAPEPPLAADLIPRHKRRLVDCAHGPRARGSRSAMTRRTSWFSSVTGIALLALQAPAAAQAQSADGPRGGVFLFRMLDGDVGRETFELVGDGWKAEGSFDIISKLKGECEATETRAEGKTALSFRGKMNGEDVSIDATLSCERFETSAKGAPAKTLDLAGKPAPLPYQDLVWAYFIDIGRELARRAGAGTLKAGETLQLVEITSAQILPLQVREFSAEERVHGGEPLAIFSFELTM